jgi:hypothetical protein
VALANIQMAVVAETLFCDWFCHTGFPEKIFIEILTAAKSCNNNSKDKSITGSIIKTLLSACHTQKNQYTISISFIYRYILL